MDRSVLRQGAAFVAVSGGGWVLDLAVFMLLSGPGALSPFTANVASGSCGALFVFLVSAAGVFRRNRGSMAPKVAVSVGFNLLVILVSSAALSLLASRFAAFASSMAWPVSAMWIRLAAKAVVTPFTLALNFVVVRYLIERFVGLLPRSGEVVR